jgi:hypothetical protein
MYVDEEERARATTAREDIHAAPRDTRAAGRRSNTSSAARAFQPGPGDTRPRAARACAGDARSCDACTGTAAHGGQHRAEFQSHRAEALRSHSFQQAAADSRIVFGGAIRAVGSAPRDGSGRGRIGARCGHGGGFAAGCESDPQLGGFGAAAA